MVRRKKSADATVLDVADVAVRASRDAGGVPPDLLDGYLEALVEVSASGGRLTRGYLESRRAVGAVAVERGVSMREVIDLYLSATWLAWPSLPGVRGSTGAEMSGVVGRAVFRAADAAVGALAEGYEEAQRWSLRREESSRREFVDDLLDGRRLDDLVERAERLGFRLSGRTVVAVATARESIVDGGVAARRVEDSVRGRVDRRDVLVTTKDGMLVCVAPDTLIGLVEEFVGQVGAALGEDAGWRVGVGRAQSGPGGPVRSFGQARDALEVAARLDLPGRVHHASDLLVFPVLMRDRAALADLVSAVLSPLEQARGGGGVLVETLAAYFACGRVATECARALHIGVRTVTYRLDRVEELTGYSADDPIQGLALHVAVLGAKLL
ncbi:PucR family transcriptional regulator [Saccharothrix variisporea]|uniref:CdaR family transcriptional regulator n=1 Tax=Saccharothrix variisporea TaxID=543527 RepID=A0A495XCM0_9PSEU|nr:helix-turn-helix domain-containing protein [Saccharothrix variisporea]RKT69288.1 CdaR family transcriptional regulator [Saccharothrix variisporea]